MFLTHVAIRNFRSISELSITPKQITTFIGKNSCGKSNILRALQFFFTASAKSAIEEDLCKFADEAGTWVRSPRNRTWRICCSTSKPAAYTSLPRERD